MAPSIDMLQQRWFPCCLTYCMKDHDLQRAVLLIFLGLKSHDEPMHRYASVKVVFDGFVSQILELMVLPLKFLNNFGDCSLEFIFIQFHNLPFNKDLIFPNLWISKSCCISFQAGLHVNVMTRSGRPY